MHRLEVYLRPWQLPFRLHRVDRPVCIRCTIDTPLPFPWWGSTDVWGRRKVLSGSQAAGWLAAAVAARRWSLYVTVCELVTFFAICSRDGPRSSQHQRLLLLALDLRTSKRLRRQSLLTTPKPLWTFSKITKSSIMPTADRLTTGPLLQRQKVSELELP